MALPRRTQLPAATGSFWVEPSLLAETFRNPFGRPVSNPTPADPSLDLARQRGPVFLAR